ncbi:hypothetical protein FACS1894219_05710 [Clostridia bacterium]|nr:hypothetical protein FACS1894219_05710 [Clostridia bacterium]
MGTLSFSVILKSAKFQLIELITGGEKMVISPQFTILRELFDLCIQSLQVSIFEIGHNGEIG